MANTKKQNTLYRFVSLRAPELSKKENQKNRFVFHIENIGLFFSAVAARDPGQSKWEAMQIASATFNEIQSVEELENINSVFYTIAEWLTINKEKETAENIYLKVANLTVLSKRVELNLWDNLFYQVLTQNSFYIKEGILQMLVLQNLLKQIQPLSDESEIPNIIPSLTNAKVVLPTILFDEQTLNPSNFTKGNPTAALKLSKEILDAHKSALAKLEIEEYENTILELKKVEKKYEKGKQAAFLDATNTYNATIAPTVEAYEVALDSAKRAMCIIPRDKSYDPNDFCNQPDIAYPKLDAFVFDYASEMEPIFIKQNLSERADQIFKDNIDIGSVETIAEAIEILNEKSKVAYKAVLSNKKYSTKVFVVGDVYIPINSQDLKASASFSFRICPNYVSNSLLNFVMTIIVPNNSYSVLDFNYSLNLTTGTNIPSSVYQSTIDGNVITITKMFGTTSNNSIVGIANNLTTVGGITGTLILSNGVETFDLDLNIEPFDIKSCSSGFLNTVENGEGEGSEENNDTFIPKGFGFRRLGIADYKKVVSEICCYDAGEVAHIENVMAREIREKITTKTHRAEVTETETTETETEKLSDTISTERFEMQTEIAKLLQEQREMSAHVNVNGTVGAYTLDAGAAYASNSSKEESNRQAVIQAKEITQRAMERIVSRVKNEKTTKVTDEFIEENKHGFDNTQSDQHVSGVYRFINAIYKNQIYNYGKRLMYEFMVPQPSKLHNLGMLVNKNNENAVLLEKPIDPRIDYPTFSTINDGNYQLLASKYNADVNKYPEQYKTIGKSFDYTSQTTNTAYSKVEAIKIDDEKYASKKALIKFSGAPPGNNSGWGKNTMVTIGNITIPFPHSSGAIQTSSLLNIIEYKNEVPVALWITNFHTVNVIITIYCELTTEAKEIWKKETYEAILEGYEEQLLLYNQKLTEAVSNGVQILDSNPLFYREIEKMVLRKNCISYLIDDTNTASPRRFGRKMYNNNATFKDHQVTLSQDMDDYGSFVKFMEQAFEWNLISYNFYPFYWGNRDEWNELYQFETNDPIFRNFMQAGMARVVVTVKPGFEDAVMHYMALGQIWSGGQMPILGDPLYLSIVDELKEQEYTIEDTWETVMPTYLIALQESGVAVDASGLPCGEDCGDDVGNHLIKNDNKLGVTVPTPTP